MNLNFRKTALMAAALAVFGLTFPVQAFAESSTAPAGQVQQKKKITGNVSDAQGPIIGASVVEKGNTGNGAVTDLDGNFTLEVPYDATIVISYIGLKDQEFSVANQSNFNVTMYEDNEMLDEVVVVGYGVQKKKLVTGATVQVKGEDIAKLNTTNALTAMQSSTPGVQITQASSQPGKGFKVNIRGVGTVGTSSPILVIDGIYSGTADDGLNGLNPNDIESIDVLKDAASAAIYGARAANGVILVTTKQGKAGKVSLQYDGYVGWSNAQKAPNVLNAQQYMQVINEAYFNYTGTPLNWSSYVPQTILDQMNSGWEGTDWFKEYENKNAIQLSHAVTLSGGTERSKFSMSLNYSYNQGIMGGDNPADYRRYGGRINSEHVLLKGKTHDIITIGENVSYWYHRSHDLAEGNGYWNVMNSAYKASPLVKAYENGTLTSYADNHAGYSDQIFNNPLNHFYAGGYNALNKSRDFGFGATIYWIIEPIKNLKYRGQFNTGYSGSNYRSVALPYSSNSTSASSNYSVTQNAYTNASFSLENTLSYILPKFGKHAFDVMIGQSIERSDWSQGLQLSASVSSADLNSLVLNGWDYNILSNYSPSVATPTWSGYDNPMYGSIASFFGRVNWNYDEKYMATAIIRADGSSNFARGHRWGYFPSISAGWVISNETWMENTKSWLDFLKLRASWGQNGNCQINNFYYLSNIGFSPTNYADYGYKFYNDITKTVTANQYTTGAYAKNVPNEDVTWETSEQFDFGIDAVFLNGRLGFNFDFYQKTTKDWLVQAPLLDVTGYEEAAMINGGDVQNRGVEIALSWRDKIGKDFNYHANFNLATNRNRVTKLGTASGMLGDDNASQLFQGSSYVALVEEGHPISYFSGMSYSGVWQSDAQIAEARAAGKAVLDDAQPGDYIWDDWNGDGVITFAGDRHQIGDPNPHVTVGLSLGCEYKGFDFGITGSGAFGMQVMQYYRTDGLTNLFTNYTTDVFDRWHGEGTSNTRARLTLGSTNDLWVSQQYMQDADYFKIQNVTLGYDFNYIWKKSPFQQLRLYVQAQNLCTITGYTGLDPEVGASGGTDSWIRGIDLGLYPTARTWIVGASIKF